MANTASGKIVLEVEARNETGSTRCRRMRRQGKVPGNVYGLDRPPFKVAVSPRHIEDLLRQGSGVNTVFALSLLGEDRTREAMIKEIHRDPVTELPLHVDFIRVDLTRKVQVGVPIRLVGLADGVKNEAGVMDFVHREVQVACLPGRIPEHLDVDISALHINQHVSISDLLVDEGVEILDDADQIIAVVTAPRVEEVPVTEEAAEAEEPEVAKKGRESEGGEAEGAAEKDAES